MATVLVVMIHYQSASAPRDGISGWVQEFLLGGVARTAVPLFALAAGYFFFLTDDGSLGCYGRKLLRRVRTLLVPYLLISAAALWCWAVARAWQDHPLRMPAGELVLRWLLRPPAEQMWFLRDLMVLVLLARPLRSLVTGQPVAYFGVLGVLWTMQWERFPSVAGWYLLSNETLLFFSIGCWSVSRRTDRLEQWVRMPGGGTAALVVAWLSLIAVRVWIDPGFDLWYARDYGFGSLWLQKCSIVVGCGAMLALAGRVSGPGWQSLAGCSFFVYLVHDFPLRSLILQSLDPLITPSNRFWLAAPLALVICFGTAALASRWTPGLLSALTGGRTPQAMSRRTQLRPAPHFD